MTQEEKQLLLKDLCGRLPYGVMMKVSHLSHLIPLDEFVLFTIRTSKEEGTPYLRPMSSMTEEEKNELNSISHEFGFEWFDAKTIEERYTASAKMQSRSIDFYNVHHLDYRELIKKGLALEAPEGMYK